VEQRIKQFVAEMPQLPAILVGSGQADQPPARELRFRSRVRFAGNQCQHCRRHDDGI
jgi:hypothetical protein